MGSFFALISRDILLAVRVGGGALLAAIFFLSIISILPFAVGPDLPLLSKIGGAILWFSALLALLLGLDRLFQSDYEDGTLDLLIMGGLAPELIVIAKIIAHWIATCLPLIIITPLLGLMLNVQLDVILALIVTLMVGTPALTSLGAVGAALTLSLSRGGMLLPIIILPLTIPVLIFGVSATTTVTAGWDGFFQPFLYLCGVSLLFLAIGPLASAAALRKGR